MTDLETMEDMLKRANITYEIGIGKQNAYITIEGGYVGFVTHITFNLDGKLINIEAFE